VEYVFRLVVCQFFMKELTMTQLALCDVRGLLTDLLQKLSGEGGAKWLSRLKKFLRGEEARHQVSWQQATRIVYELCDLGAEFLEAIQSFDLKDEEGLWKLLMVKGLTYERMTKAYEKAGVTLQTFGVNLQEKIGAEKEQRDPNRDGSYSVKFHGNMEADEVNKNESANHRAEKEYEDSTLLERLFMGLVVFLTGEGHLDQKTVTLCSGSRHSGGRVPFVHFHPDDGGVHVDWYGSDVRYVSLRVRSVVSSS